MMKKYALLAGLFSLALCQAPAVMAQNIPLGAKGEPLEIEADETLEWNREAKQYVARGKASAKQGEFQIEADTLTADYRESEKSSTDIYQVTAEGNVTITNAGNVATGMKAIYNIADGKAVMTGDNLKMTSPEQSVTASERFEYDVTANTVKAIGKAVVIRGDQTLSADEMSALFEKDAQGQNKLSRITATRNVVIKTPTETLTGSHGVYTAATQIAEISGPVRIERGPNILEGQRAEVNLATNISKIDGGPGKDGKPGRVRGIFYTSDTQAPVPQAKDDALLDKVTDSQ